jgi:hypothetical protein
VTDNILTKTSGAPPIDSGFIYLDSSFSENVVKNSIITPRSPLPAVLLLRGGNIETNYSAIDDAAYAGSNNNLTLPFNPAFVDPANRDFHLQVASPCIDAGDPAVDYNDPDADGGGNADAPALGTVTNDMGAYGGPGAANGVGVQGTIGPQP